MIDRTTTLQAVRNIAPYEEGDILESEEGHRAVITQLLASVTQNMAYYRVEWKTGDQSVLLPVRATHDMRYTGKMRKPYTWE